MKRTRHDFLIYLFICGVFLRGVFTSHKSVFTGQQAVLEQQNPTPRENVKGQQRRGQGISGQELNGNDLNTEIHRSTKRKKEKKNSGKDPQTDKLGGCLVEPCARHTQADQSDVGLLVVPGGYMSRLPKFQGQHHDSPFDPAELWPKTLDKEEKQSWEEPTCKNQSGVEQQQIRLMKIDVSGRLTLLS